ncbi:MAG TPA: sulfite exporter TauE/SafE family protein [Enteractinococcus helveticum]|uniref:Probable membrane transporter protein n=1 Tax=Enteractinococcus helveticum TaxID=1837282 RepID=A0A921K7S8_9MICC|nr:sulfite exporter TauE/SafE family protein [Enteractinococcus helveticum]HJF15110.1 sulfite exporter TauE/SafE family protein [Enteractinococcus helveticum]
MLIGILLLSFIATALQRITGLGFAMLTAPFAVVALGTHQGIMLITALAVIASLFMLPGMWRDIDWSRVGWIGIPATLSIIPAAWLGAQIDGAIIYLLVGALVIVGLSGALFMRGNSQPVTSHGAQILTGVGAGAGSVLAGIGGPAMTIFGVLSRWPVASFAASLQPMWVMIASATLAGRSWFMGSTLPELSWWMWLLAVVGIAVGMWAGQRALGKVKDGVVFGIVIVLAMIGAILSVITGISQLL